LDYVPPTELLVDDVKAALREAAPSAAAPANNIETYKASMNGDGLRILDHLPQIIQRGHESLTPAEKELLKWLGIFYRKPTPGHFMMRLRMPNGFTNSAQLRAIADLSRRLGNSVIDITTRQQIELRGFTLDSIPAIWEKLQDVDLRSLQTGIDNVRNINGCALAGLTPHELFDASPVVHELDRLIVGTHGNLEFSNLPRKFNIVVTACMDNCTHNESQDIALIPAKKGQRLGFNILVGGKMGSGGFTIASHLNVFVERFQAAAVVIQLIKIFRDHGPRQARSKCRFSFLVEKWGIPRLRAELTARIGYELAFQGRDMRTSHHADHLGLTPQKQSGLTSVGLCIPTGRINPDQLDELAHLSDLYGNGELRLTAAQNAVLTNIPAGRVSALLTEPLLQQFSPQPSPFLRGLVACVGTDYCNLALIETKSRALDLSAALHKKLGPGTAPLTIHWSGCPAGCGNHEAADLGLRGFKTRMDGQLVDAVAVYVGGRTGANAAPGKEILATVPCDHNFPDLIAKVLQNYSSHSDSKFSPAPEPPLNFPNNIPTYIPLFPAAATVGLASWRNSPQPPL
jgi:ferredoxin-nitrite reductase